MEFVTPFFWILTTAATQSQLLDSALHHVKLNSEQGQTHRGQFIRDRIYSDIVCIDSGNEIPFSSTILIEETEVAVKARSLDQSNPPEAPYEIDE